MSQRPPDYGPVYLAKAIITWIVVAVITLIVVWVLVFAATRGDALGTIVLLGTLAILSLGMSMRYRRRRSIRSASSAHSDDHDHDDQTGENDDQLNRG